MLIGERIRLRPFREDELKMIEDWLEYRERGIGPWQPCLLGQGAEVREALGGNLTPTREHAFLAVEHLEDSRVIGLIRYGQQKMIPGMAEFYEVGYGITDLDMRGKGYAHEACTLLLDYLFGAYPVERVCALVTAVNEPSVGLLERLGFCREGVIRRALFFDGTWHDLALYGLLREEWKTDG